MTDPQPPRKERHPLPYGTRRQRMGRGLTGFANGAGGAWLLLFGAVFFTERRWFWITVAAVAVLCAGYAIFMQPKKPALAAGIWVGIGVGLLNATWCYQLTKM